VHALLIEDDSEAARFLVKGLRESGHTVEHAADGRVGLAQAVSGPFDIVITDRMLPHLDGLAVIEGMRAKGIATPVLVLSALGSVDDRIKGLKAGGDDYLTKPFAFEELLARVRALLRRGPASDTVPLRFADLVLDRTRMRARREGREIPLTNREFALLEFFLRRPGEVLTRAVLAEHVWGTDFDSESNVIDVTISHLRGKIDRGPGPPLIHTVRGLGYVLRPPKSDEG